MGQPTQISEKELIEGCIRQEKGMQRLLFDRFAGKMMTVCRRYTRNKMEAEDLLQDGFIKAFTRLEQHNHGSLEGWLRRIFVNTCLNHWRDSRNGVYSFDIVDVELANQEEDSIQKLQAAELLLLIEKLPDGARLIFNLFAIEGYPHAEIAEMLHITEGASRSQLTRARKILQEQLKLRTQV